MTTEAETRPCEDFCGTVPRGRDAHSNECRMSLHGCLGARDMFGNRIPGTSCWCSPGCRDAGRRLGGPAAGVVHSPGGVNGASCGAPFTVDIRFTAKPSKVTCPACLTAMGEPAVVGGPAWVEFPATDKHIAQLPAERRNVLVAIAAAAEGGYSTATAVGYLRHSSGGPFFVVPGFGRTFTVTHWCDCLGDGFRSPAWPGTVGEHGKPTQPANQDGRVVSGLDTAAATPERTCPKCEWAESDCSCGAKAAPPPPARPSRVEVGPVKPTAVAVGQRWRDVDGAYTVVGRPATWDDWVLERDNGAEVSYGSGDILADEYLGTVPAPVSAPPPKEPAMNTDSVPNTPLAQAILKALVDSRAGRNYYDDTRMLLRVLEPYRLASDVSAPGQSTPVETPPTEAEVCSRCDGYEVEPGPDGDDEPCRKCQAQPPIHAAGFVAEGGTKWGTHCGAPVSTSLMAGASQATCRACLDKLGVAAAPAPGGGEGPRELTFAEAMALDPSQVECRFDEQWWLLKDPRLSATLTLRDLRISKFRLARPGPLPAPAPRVSRVAEMSKAGYEEWVKSSDRMPMLKALAERVVEATLEAVRTATAQTWTLETALDRARAAMLEPR